MYSRGSVGASTGFPNSSQLCFAAHNAASSLFFRASSGGTAAGCRISDASTISSASFRRLLRLAFVRRFCSNREVNIAGNVGFSKEGSHLAALGFQRTETLRFESRLAYASRHPDSIPGHLAPNRRLPVHHQHCKEASKHPDWCFDTGDCDETQLGHSATCQ